ncbi:MAG: hypothetical protein BRD37_04160 [Bacteroidetes bacterium QH_8_67_23]|nr:MAG: hypothetical protein BRD37_04160 [Bacteroidetes bacterium QH_8_67_23]
MPAIYNERSWAADLIAHLNRLADEQRLNVKRAGGEHTIRDDEGLLFPDVLLFGDEAGQAILQGWELKMPDTPVTDADLLANAERKARGLGLNSFLVWNVDRAVLYVAGEDSESYQSEKSWALPGGPAGERGRVADRRADWKALVETILQDVDRLLGEGVLRDRTLVDAFSERALIEALFENVPRTAEQLQEAARRDNRFQAKVDLWWSHVEEEHAGEEKLDVLARRSLTGWISKFVFAHVLKTACADARSVESLPEGATAADVQDAFESISQACNFLNIFRAQLGEDRMAGRPWSQIAQVNGFLSEVDLQSVGAEARQGLLRNTVSAAKRKAAGQFTTPPPLARLLVRVAARDRTGVVFDPCCGTGTIPAAAYAEKRDAGQPAREALDTVWASDKFTFPLQAATLALARPEHMGAPLHVFQNDVLDLEVESEVTFHDPSSGDEIQKPLPPADCIVSNLPFVQFEDVEEANPTIERVNERIEALAGEEVRLPGRSDLYAYLPFHLWTLLAEGGRAGLILSNAWLGTDWGRDFRHALQRFYHIEKIIVSGAGRWFQNTDVVTTLLILERRTEVASPAAEEETAFITTKKDLGALDGDDDLRPLASRVTLDRAEPEWTTVQTHTSKDIERFERLGVEWSGLFADVGWLEEAESELIAAHELFEIGRGERRGWNALFYPNEKHRIEEAYLEGCLKRPASAKGLVAEPDVEAFSCSRNVEELEARGDRGALAWIQKFEHETNTTGRPLPDVLARSGRHWYEMRADTLADLVLPVNPYRRLFVPKLRERAFVDQRFTRFTLTDDHTDADLCHALLNSAVGLFLVEALGFGRGLGALDLSTTRAKRQLHILNPRRLNDEQEKYILKAFRPLLDRPVETVPEELARDDRRAFDRTVLEAFDLLDLYEPIRTALRELYDIRMAVND